MEIRLNLEDTAKHFAVTFTGGRLARGFNTITKQVKTTADSDEIKRWLSNKFTIAEPSYRECFGMVHGDKDCIFTMTTSRWGAEVSFTGEPSKVQSFVDDTSKKFGGNHPTIRWVYDHQYLDSVDIPMSTTNMPSIEMYPFLGEDSLEDFYQRYLDSPANILVLIGPPGTGKTTFIRGLLAHANSSASLTYNNKVIQSESFFVEWLESDQKFMILEDSDNLLLPRSEGNDLMSRFLNVGDGLMSFNKKMIFSTNLPNVSDIDDALTRPGRCFDIVEFQYLSKSEAKLVADKFNLEIDDKEKYALSEVFAKSRTNLPSKKKSKFGFM